jgi:hypothetical protein
MAKRQKVADQFDGIKAAMGIPVSRVLDMATPMHADVSRIGYPDEGIRVTVGLRCPFDAHFEVQLSRSDAEWLIARLLAELASPRNDNLLIGKK